VARPRVPLLEGELEEMKSRKGPNSPVRAIEFQCGAHWRRGRVAPVTRILPDAMVLERMAVQTQLWRQQLEKRRTAEQPRPRRMIFLRQATRLRSCCEN